MVNSKATKPFKRWWAIGNSGGYGRGVFIDEAVRNCIKQGWAAKATLRPDFIVYVYEMDPDRPMTHVLGHNGEPVHAPHQGDQLYGHLGYESCFKRDVEPRKFAYSKGRYSDAGRHLMEIGKPIDMEIAHG